MNRILALRNFERAVIAVERAQANDDYAPEWAQNAVLPVVEWLAQQERAAREIERLLAGE